MYTAVVLNEESYKVLMTKMRSIIPAEWETICHHMTINLGGLSEGPAAGLKIGHQTALLVKEFAQDDKVMAVKVDCMVPSINTIKHITVAVNRAAGGVPYLSNKLTEWNPIEPFMLEGCIEECQ